METNIRNKCKAYTSLEQSQKLAEILPLESADMTLPFTHKENNEYVPGYAVSRNYIEVYNEMLLLPAMDKDIICKLIQPCWSLTALLDVLPSILFGATPKRKELYLLPGLDKSYCFYRQFAVKTKGKLYLLTEGECPVDACVAMIEELHEQKLL